MKKTKKMKNVLTRFLAMAMVCCLCLALSPLAIVYAEGDDDAEWKDNPTSITELEPMIEESKVTKPHLVKFADEEWYVIGYNDIGDEYHENAEKITLLHKTGLNPGSFMNSRKNNSYKDSLVRDQLNIFTNAIKVLSDAIAETDLEDVCLTGEKFYLLSESEAKRLSTDLLTNTGSWWLRSRGSSKILVMFVSNLDGSIKTEKVDRIKYNRPAVKLKLSSVVYLPESNEIKLIQEIAADDVTVTYGETETIISARVTTPETGGGEISYAVKEGSEDYIDVDPSTGVLTIKNVPPDGKAYVTVTAAETETHGPAAKDVTVTIKGGLVTPDETAGLSEAGSIFGEGNGMMIAALSAAALLAMAGGAIFIKRRRK